MKKHNKEKAELDDIQVSKDYSASEISPYRLWVSKTNGNNHNQFEKPTANPDVLLEEDGLYYQRPCDDERLDTIYQIAKKLPMQERLILHLVGVEGRTMENTAAILKVTKRKVQVVIEKIRKLALQK